MTKQERIRVIVGDDWYDVDECYDAKQAALEALEDVDNMPPDDVDEEDEYDFLENEYGEAKFIPIIKRNHEDEYEESKREKRDRQARNIARRSKEFHDHSQSEEPDADEY